jgi:hypothetical protein
VVGVSNHLAGAFMIELPATFLASHRVATSHEIRSWSFGMVKKPLTGIKGSACPGCGNKLDGV